MDNNNVESKLGFTEFAETWNGRLAMIGFVSAIAVEFVTGQGVLAQLGLM
ncbi:MAG: chlorophyll a/b-binding protein [Phormidesmis sp.]